MGTRFKTPQKPPRNGSEHLIEVSEFPDLKQVPSYLVVLKNCFGVKLQKCFVIYETFLLAFNQH